MTKKSFETPEIPPRKKAEKPQERACSHEGCTEPGAYPAPRSRKHLRDYIWLCLEHVRDYNRKWNYFDGYDEMELEQAIRSSTTWERPSWKFGTSQKGGDAWKTGFDDPFDALGNKGDNDPSTPRIQITREQKKAWTIFGLSPCTNPETVKKRYKELAKEHHPDANGGSKQSEDRLKTINWAYSVLKAQFNRETSS